MERKEIAYQIGAHLEKYYATNSVKFPQTIFKIKQIAEVSIKEDTISKLSYGTTFKGSATITISDTTTNILTTLKKRNIEGVALIEEIQNLPKVKYLTITTINL